MPVCSKLTKILFEHLCQRGYVIHQHPFLCWFVSRITQKLFKRLSQDLNGERVSAQTDPNNVSTDLDKGTDYILAFSQRMMHRSG